MDIKELISRIESVEDLFSLLGVSLDPKVVAVHRMRILRRFGREMEALDKTVGPISDCGLRSLYAEALERILEQCSRGMREPEPLLCGQGQQLVQLRRGPPKGDPLPKCS